LEPGGPVSDMTDSGAISSDGLAFMLKSVPEEKSWPYLASSMNKPVPAAVVEAGVPHRIQKAVTVVDDAATSKEKIDAIYRTLQSGLPVAVGIQVYASFESDQVARNGEVPTPNIKRDSFVGGHAVTILGYLPATQQFIMLNSWGASWGEKGCFFLHSDYITNPLLAGGFLTLLTD